jgi:ABC-type lipoprotein release transport system permease subunit
VDDVLKPFLLALLVACSSNPSTPTAVPVANAGGAATTAEAAKAAVLAFNGHVIVLKSSSNFAEYRDVMATARALDPEVVAVSPILFVDATVKTAKTTVAVGLKGLVTEATRARTDIAHYVSAGTLPADAVTTGEIQIALGDAVATQLGVRLGDTVDVEVQLANVNPDTWARETRTVSRHARLAGIVHLGIPELDGRLAFASFPSLMSLLERTDAIGVEVRLVHPDAAPRIAKQLDVALGGPYQVKDWCELNRAFLHC